MPVCSFRMFPTVRLVCRCLAGDGRWCFSIFDFCVPFIDGSLRRSGLSFPTTINRLPPVPFMILSQAYACKSTHSITISFVQLYTELRHLIYEERVYLLRKTFRTSPTWSISSAYGLVRTPQTNSRLLLFLLEMNITIATTLFFIFAYPLFFLAAVSCAKACGNRTSMTSSSFSDSRDLLFRECYGKNSAFWNLHVKRQMLD